MKHVIYYFIFMLAWGCSMQPNQPQKINSKEVPNDYFFRQRAFPQGKINTQAYRQALDQANLFKNSNRENVASWESVGPNNVGGRITAISMHPSSEEIIYAGAASGGVFKSTDQGESWTPIFDGALSLSIGDLQVAPSNPNTIYVGTGESNGGGGSITYDGFGIYKSTDAGQTWTHLGLEEGRNTGRIAIHPNNENIVYAAMMGDLFGDNEERGIYRTIDGGANWDKVLFVSEKTGGADLAIDPSNPEIVYATMWERVRTPGYKSYGGPTSGIYKSTMNGDAGTWVELTNGLPSNGSKKGRIGITICDNDPSRLYAVYAKEDGTYQGSYKTYDMGNSWQELYDYSISWAYGGGSGNPGYGWWFGRIAVHPDDCDIVYVLGISTHRTLNGYDHWIPMDSETHADAHEYYIHGTNHSLHIVGNDGGIYVSTEGGALDSWKKSRNLPITQFYACEVDEQNNLSYYGGSQDNGTYRTINGTSWRKINGGDGFNPLVNPQNNNYVYSQIQYGRFYRSTSGGTSFSLAMSGIMSDRKNWNTPAVFDPNNPAIIYYGSNRLYKTTNHASNWAAISPDLTFGDPVGNNLTFGTLTTIAVSKSSSNTIYTGADDGRVNVTFDGGGVWNDITMGLPNRWITRLAVDPEDSLHVYVTLSGYRHNEFLPHVFETFSGGEEWNDISKNLPEAPANDIVIDKANDRLYLATDVGVFATNAQNINWYLLGEGLPNVPVTDLRLHEPTSKLVAATYGRSMYKLGVDQLVDLEVSTSYHDICHTSPPSQPPYASQLFVGFGWVQLHITNGTAPYTITWDNPPTSSYEYREGIYISTFAQPGNYCVTVTDQSGMSWSDCFEIGIIETQDFCISPTFFFNSRFSSFGELTPKLNINGSGEWVQSLDFSDNSTLIRDFNYEGGVRYELLETHYEARLGEVTYIYEEGKYSDHSLGALNQTKIKSVYPNPFNDHIIVEFDKQRLNERAMSLSITDISGKELFVQLIDIGSTGIIRLDKIRSEQLSKGVYFARITQGNQMIDSYRILKH